MNCLNERKRIEKIFEKVKRDLKISNDTKSVIDFDAVSGTISYIKTKYDERLSISNVNGEVFDFSLTKDTFSFDYYLLGYKDIYLKVDGGINSLFIESGKYIFQSEKLNGKNELLEEIKYKDINIKNKKITDEATKNEILSLIFRNQNKCIESINDIIKYDKKYKNKVKKLERQG